jgi:cytochrome c-type biogenesis protein
LILAAAAVASSPLWWKPVAEALYELEFALAEVVPEARIVAASWYLLPIIGLASGVLASLSPCVLPLVPLNLAYIGAAEASGWRAVSLSARFVAGAALALSALGLAGDLAGFVLIEQRGVMLLIVGLALVYFGLIALEVVPLPFPGRGFNQRRFGPVGAGATFALITTPCASPLLAAVLTAAAAQSVPGLSVATMVGFALGYTILVFLGGAFGGGIVARAKQISSPAPRAAAAALLVVTGFAFAAAGAAWF